MYARKEVGLYGDRAHIFEAPPVGPSPLIEDHRPDTLTLHLTDGGFDLIFAPLLFYGRIVAQYLLYYRLDLRPALAFGHTVERPVDLVGIELFYVCYDRGVGLLFEQGHLFFRLRGLDKDLLILGGGRFDRLLRQLYRLYELLFGKLVHMGNLDNLVGEHRVDHRIYRDCGLYLHIHAPYRPHLYHKKILFCTGDEQIERSLFELFEGRV